MMRIRFLHWKSTRNLEMVVIGIHCQPLDPESIVSDLGELRSPCQVWNPDFSCALIVVLCVGYGAGGFVFRKIQEKFVEIDSEILKYWIFWMQFRSKLLNVQSLWFVSDLGTSYFQPKLSSWTAVFCSLVEKDKGYGVEPFFFSESHLMFSPEQLKKLFVNLQEYIIFQESGRLELTDTSWELVCGGGGRADCKHVQHETLHNKCWNSSLKKH